MIRVSREVYERSLEYNSENNWSSFPNFNTHFILNFPEKGYGSTGSTRVTRFFTKIRECEKEREREREYVFSLFWIWFRGKYFAH